jgi:hypothetical protein
VFGIQVQMVDLEVVPVLVCVPIMKQMAAAAADIQEGAVALAELVLAAAAVVITRVLTFLSR